MKESDKTLFLLSHQISCYGIDTHYHDPSDKYYYAVLHAGYDYDSDEGIWGAVRRTVYNNPSDYKIVADLSSWRDYYGSSKTEAFEVCVNHWISENGE